MRARIHVLGRFGAERSGRSIPASAWRRRRALDLVKLIAIAPGHAIHREEVIDKLWPDKDLDAGANNLHRALYDIRSVLGEGVVIADKGVVRFGERVWVDLDAFESGISSSDPAQRAEALAFYAGDLCPDDPYNEALGARREALRRRFVHTALELTRAAANHNDHAAAIDFAQRLVAVDPGCEPGHRFLMSSLAASGRRHDAIQQFGACVKALRAALDTEASAETVAAYQSILHGAGGSAPSQRWRAFARRAFGGDVTRTLHGRRVELEYLERFLGGGHGALVVLGDAGIGKTRFVVEAARRAEERGAFVLAGQASDLEGMPPYTPFLDAFATASVEDPFAQFKPTGSSQDDKLRLFRTVERALADTNPRGAVMLIVEDLHLCDESSLHLFHYLARAARISPQRRLFLVGTCRDEESRPGRPVHQLLVGLARERVADRLLLERLDRRASRACMTDLLGRAPSDVVDRAVYGLAEGNPFFTEEVVRSLERVGVKIPTVPEDLGELLRARVSRAGRDAAVLLAAASACGQRFDFEQALAISGLDLPAGLDALDRCVAAKLVVDEESAYRFHHALVRESVYAGLTRARREHFHAAAAAWLEKRSDETVPDRDERLAYHFRSAQQLGRALPHFVRAGRRAAARVGFREALAYFEQARDGMDTLGQPPDANRYELLLGMGGMKLALSDLDAAVIDLDAAAALRRDDGWRPRPDERAKALRWSALACITAGRLIDAATRLERALADLDEIGGHVERAEALYLLAQLRWHEGRHREAYETAEMCLVEAERHGDKQVIARGYEMLALACHSLGEWREGIEHENKRSALAGQALDVAQVFDVHL